MNAQSADKTRGLFSLFNGRWHRSSRTMSSIALFLLVFCNLPGQHVLRVGDRLESGMVSEVIEHGWPFTYLTRSYWQAEKDPIEENLFFFWEQVEEFRVGFLFINVLMVLVVSLLAGSVFEFWRRRRKHLFQFHLRDLIGVTIVISLIGAWLANQRLQYYQEQRILALLNSPSEEKTTRPWTVRKSEGGITWVRRTIGDAPFQFLDRVVETGADAQVLSQVSGLRQLAVLHVEGPLSSRDLTALADCRRLKWLDLTYAEPKLADLDLKSPATAEQTLDLPRVGALRGLFLNGPTCRLRGLAQLQNLQTVDLASADRIVVPESKTIEELARIPRIYELFLGSTKLSGGQLEPLTRCSNLEQLDLSHCVLDEDSFRHLGRIRSLRKLWLVEAKFDTSNLRHLVNLSNLRELNLADVPFSSTEYVHLSNLPVRELTLSGENLNKEAVIHLKSMKQLRRLSATRVSEETERALSDQLPKCEVNLRLNQ